MQAPWAPLRGLRLLAAPRSAEAVALQQKRVLHLATHLDSSVLQLLGPATTALARAGSGQTLVLIDDSRSRALLPQLDDSTDLVRVAPRRYALASWRALSRAFAEALAAHRPDTVHLHGFVACVLGERQLARLAVRIPALYSPHGGDDLGPLEALAVLAHRLGRSRRGAATAPALGHGTAEAGALEDLGHRVVAVVEGPVDSAYFDVAMQAARHPLVVSAGGPDNVRGAEAFDQLAVLLGGEALGLSFNWIGPVDAVTAARLKAANVGVFDATEHAERATRLAAAWMFVALGGDRGFPLSLAEAMAVGLPCVALDLPAYRGLIRHGDTGYLCRSQAEVIDRIAQLADTPSLRESMGHAGRALAQERFGRGRFEQHLFAAYTATQTAAAPALRLIPAGQGRIDPEGPR
jgi:glycosyltransferase involved in cell wall biosynthesis